jgi:hypothetical protein
MAWLRGLSYTEYSEGETRLFWELQARRITLYMASHRGIELNYEEDGVYGCRPDFMWGPPAYAVFLDGDPHKSSHVARRDALIKVALEKRGFTVDRFSYRTPLSKKRCREIVDAIQERLNSL